MKCYEEYLDPRIQSYRRIRTFYSKEHHLFYGHTFKDLMGRIEMENVTKF
jgi:hypothetical protein